MNEITIDAEPDGEIGQSAPATSTELVIAGRLTPAVVFREGGVEDVLGKLEREVRAIKTDISTPKGRKAIASLALKVARSKTALDEMGKRLTDQWRVQAEAVHAERRTIIARLDALRDEVRKPLTDWENADKLRIAGHEAALAAIPESSAFYASEQTTVSDLEKRLLSLLALPVRDWQEFAQPAADTFQSEIELTEEALKRAREREAAAAEAARLQAEAEERARQEAARLQAEREARIAAEAAERATREAEAAAEQRRLEAERAVQAERQRLEDEARAEAQRAEAERQQVERDRQAAEERAARAEAAQLEAARLAEENRVKAAAQAERDRELAIEAERRRVANLAAAQQREAEARAADLEHRKKVNNAALAVILSFGITEEQGKRVLTAIAKGDVPNVSIAY